MTNPDLFRPLRQAARQEIARQINAGKPDAAALATIGFSWNIAGEIADQISTRRPSALNLWKLGLSGPVSMAIATAINDRFAPAPPAEPKEPSSQGAKRGAARPGKAWRGVKGNYLRKVAP